MRNILFSLFILTLSGCSHLDNSDNVSPYLTMTWEEHQQKIQTLSNWSLSGKLAIFTKDDRQTANIYWRQQGDNYTIELTSFIGTQILSINKNEQGVEITNYNGDVYKGENTEKIIHEMSPGLDLPISDLQQWIKGNPSEASYTLNANQRIDSLLSSKSHRYPWAVTYQQYDVFSGYFLPLKLNLKRNKIRLKIAIHEWQIEE